MSEYSTVTGIITAPGLDPVTVELGSYPTWALPLSSEWKKSRREMVLSDLGHRPSPGDGWRVSFKVCAEEP